MKIQKLHGYDNIYMVEGFLEEFQNLFKNNKFEAKKKQMKLFQHLVALDHHQERNFPKVFEKIEDGIYSIRDVSTSNPRVLYTYISDGNHILLGAFKEKSKNDYSKNVHRVREILKEVLKEYDT